MSLPWRSQQCMTAVGYARLHARARTDIEVDELPVEKC
jgi:hypothetical protein